MNRRHRQLLLWIYAEPTPTDLRWGEIEGLLRALGVEVTEGAGSRVRVALNGVRAVFHRPHPSPEIKRGAVRALRAFFDTAGVRPAGEPEDV